MNTAYRGAQAQEVRLKRRAEELCAFFKSRGHLPSFGSSDPVEMGLCLFLTSTIRPRFREGVLRPDVVSLLETIPGALKASPPVIQVKRTPTPRQTAFERWLVRAEIYTARNGYRPTYTDDNGLYQWLNRARRKLAAGDLNEEMAARVVAIMNFPDIRTHRYWEAHGRPSPEEGRKRYFTD